MEHIEFQDYRSPNIATKEEAWNPISGEGFVYDVFTILNLAEVFYNRPKAAVEMALVGGTIGPEGFVYGFYLGWTKAEGIEAVQDIWGRHTFGKYWHYLDWLF